MTLKKLLLAAGALTLVAACTNNDTNSSDEPRPRAKTTELPAPQPGTTTEVRANVVGWPANRTPLAPEGFEVVRFAAGFDNPRWIYVGPDGDVFVSEANTLKVAPSANRITRLRDEDGDGVAEFREIFASDLNQPLGMLILGDSFYVADTDAVWRYPYKKGQASLDKSARKKILTLPAGGYNNHWTRNLIAKPDGQKIYVSVGSASNVGEYGMKEEIRRANILEINPDGSGERVFAYGLRNPVGMDWNPVTGALWSAVNERDELGDELVPDYVTSVREGGFYGWPYAYIGNNPDPRWNGQRSDLIEKSIVPDILVGSHTASLSLLFQRSDKFPAAYREGLFVSQHGSWNRSELAGYKVLFIPFANGRASGPEQDFLKGFIVKEGEIDVYGKPVGLAQLPGGELLVADDSGNTVWLVRAK